MRFLPHLSHTYRYRDLNYGSTKICCTPTEVYNLSRVDHSHIEFRNVTFGYSASDRALADVSLTIPHGAFAAVVGPSGSGKSTLLKMIAGLHEPQDGSILIDGQDLRHLTTASLRNGIALVPQDSVISDPRPNGNIRDATVVLLDEAAGDIDPVTERNLGAAIPRIRSAATTHRARRSTKGWPPP